MTIELEPLFAASAALHRHLCPRQLLGVRMGVHAGEVLGLQFPQEDKRALAFIETDGCFADGIMVATGCSLGHRTMRLWDYGKVAVTVVDTKTARAVRLRPAPDSRARAALWAPAAPNRWQAQMEAYQSMPAMELLRCEEVILTVSVDALIGRPGVRVACSICGEEVINGRERIEAGRPVCSSCAGDAYWIAKERFQRASRISTDPGDRL